MKSTGAQSSNELEWLDLKIGRQNSGPSDGHKGDMHYYSHCIKQRLSFSSLWFIRNNVVNNFLIPGK